MTGWRLVQGAVPPECQEDAAVALLRPEHCAGRCPGAALFAQPQHRALRPEEPQHPAEPGGHRQDHRRRPRQDHQRRAFLHIFP